MKKLDKYCLPSNRLVLVDRLLRQIPAAEVGRLSDQNKVHRVFMSCALTLLACTGQRKEVKSRTVRYGLRLRAPQSLAAARMGDLYLFFDYTKGKARSTSLVVFEQDPETRKMNRVFSSLYFCGSTQSFKMSDGLWQQRIVATAKRIVAAQMRRKDELVMLQHLRPTFG